MSVRNFRDQPRAYRRSPPGPRHVRFRPGFVDKNEMLGIKPRLLHLPLRSLLRNIGPVLLGRFQHFFFKVSFSFRNAVQSVWRLSSVPSASLSSCNVMSGRLATCF